MRINKAQQYQDWRWLENFGSNLLLMSPVAIWVGIPGWHHPRTFRSNLSTSHGISLIVAIKLDVAWSNSLRWWACPTSEHYGTSNWSFLTKCTGGINRLVWLLGGFVGRRFSGDTIYQMKVGARSRVKSTSCKKQWLDVGSQARSKLIMQWIVWELRMKEPWINRFYTAWHCVRFESLPLPFVNIIAAACLHPCFLMSWKSVASFLQLLKSNGEAFRPTSEDKFLWYLNPLLPESLPKPVMQQGRKFDHHLIMEMTELPRCISRINHSPRWKHRTFKAIFHGRWCKMTTLK